MVWYFETYILNKVKFLEKNKWKCKACSYIYESAEHPKSCIICESKEFEKIESKIFDVENLESTEKKKKYKIVFKKGFTRKYKKFK